MFLYNVLILSSLCSNFVFGIYPCPEDSEISPCSCSLDVGNRQQIDCSNASSEEELITAFEANFTVKYAYSFTIQNNINISSLSNVFNGMAFTRVELQQMVNLRSIANDTFADSSDELEAILIIDGAITADFFPFETLGTDLGYLRTLIFENCPLGSFPRLSHPNITTVSYKNVSAVGGTPGTFDDAPKLRSIDLSKNTLNTLQVDTFTIRDTALNLNLGYNQMSSLQPGFFKFDPANGTFYNEVQLYLFFNSLTTIQALTFPLRDGHHAISISNNQISTIVPGAFVMPETTKNLQLELYLYNNEITTLAESVFGEIFPYLNLFYAYNNPLDCACDVSWIILNDGYVEKLDDWTECPNGIPLKDQNKTFYLENC